MKQSPEDIPGVGEVQRREPERTGLRDALASTGLLSLYLATSELRLVAGSRPTEFIGAAQLAQQLQRISALVEVDLQQAGYDPADIKRVPESDVATPAKDPSKPRTN